MSAFIFATSYICTSLFVGMSFVLVHLNMSYAVPLPDFAPIIFVTGWSSLLWFLDYLYVQLREEQ